MQPQIIYVTASFNMGNIENENELVVQTLWCWSSTSTAVAHVGGQPPLIGNTTGKKETRLMDSMVESGN